MKFKDKDGNMFEDIDSARKAFCKSQEECDLCPIALQNNGLNASCYALHFVAAEAARLMGYEVVEDAANDRQMTADAQQ